MANMILDRDMVAPDFVANIIEASPKIYLPPYQTLCQKW